MSSPNAPTLGHLHGSKSDLLQFLLVLAAIAVLRLVVGFVALPDSWLAASSLIVSVVFMTLPILGFYKGAKYSWRPISALLLLLSGVFVQVAGYFCGALAPNPVIGGIINAVGQTGLLCWTFGLGALLTTLLKDKNIILPVAVALALFDVWLVFAPEGVAGQEARGPQVMLGRIAYQSPMPSTHSMGGFAHPLAYVGPADFLFLAMFFVALYKFQMRTKETFWAMMPTLAAYLLVVLVFGSAQIGPFKLGALPALLPIGAVILAVNRREFKLSRDEAITTVAVAIIGLALVSWRITVSNAREQQAASSRRVRGPRGPARAQTPTPDPRG